MLGGDRLLNNIFNSDIADGVEYKIFDKGERYEKKIVSCFFNSDNVVTFPAASFAAGGQNDVGQLYWFNGDSVELDGNRVVEYFGETNPKNFNTEDTIVLKAPNTYTCGYFALQSNGEYFVMTGLNEIFRKRF